MLGQVPGFIDDIPDSASDHSWGLFRDLQMGADTDLSPREKALVGVGVAAAISCPYCTYFHTEEARMSDVTDDELKEAVTLAGETKYFSTVLHGHGTDLDEFESQTDEIVEYVQNHQMAADD